MGKRGYFKAEEEEDGEPVGPLWVYDEDDPDDEEEVGWMALSVARRLAREQGFELDEDI